MSGATLHYLQKYPKNGKVLTLFCYFDTGEIKGLGMYEQGDYALLHLQKIPSKRYTVYDTHHGEIITIKFNKVW